MGRSYDVATLSRLRTDFLLEGPYNSNIKVVSILRTPRSKFCLDLIVQSTYQYDLCDTIRYYMISPGDCGFCKKAAGTLGTFGDFGA